MNGQRTKRSRREDDNPTPPGLRPMHISLRSGERPFLNGAVLRVDRKVTLELLNDATFLLENHVLQVEDAAAGERHRLAVIPGPRAARGDGDVFGIAGFQDLDDLCLGLRRRDEIGHNMVQPVFQNRGIPKEIAAFGLYAGRIDINLNPCRFQRCDRVLNAHVSSIKWSSAA